jgi:lysyl-tRNA synthetase class 2
MAEFLVINDARALAARSGDRLSLNVATWARLFADGVRLAPVQRARRAAQPHFQITSLRDFNGKLDSEWVPRRIVVEDLEALPRAALLYVSVEGFLRTLIGGRLVPPVPAEPAR